MKTFRLSLFIVLNVVLINLIFANDIIIDNNASKAYQPQILKTPNDVLVVNITTPKNGISMNEYKKFDTPQTGTILNNSHNGSKTYIGGFINANPNLASGSAKLIVNKVNSNNPSNLKGNLEIAGSKADIMIANPSGININGLNIINARSSTFTTSNVNINNANQIAKNQDISYLNNNSKITVENGGLNDSSSDYTNIISNTIKILGNIHSNELNLKANSKNNTEVAIDSAIFGGMYANKIKIIAINDGVGVNNGGVIVGNEVKINTNGDIINKGIIYAKDSSNLKSSSLINEKNFSNEILNIDILSNKLSNDGEIIANNLAINASDEIINSNLIQAKNNAKLIANNISNKANILSLGNIDIKANFNLSNLNGANIISDNKIIIKSQTLQNASSNIASDNIQINSEYINNYTTSNIDVYSQTKSKKINLRCCGARSFNLSVNLKDLKDEIINEWKINNINYTEVDLDNELYKRAVSLDNTLYILDLHKRDRVHGSLLYSNLRLDEVSNKALINIWHIKNHERGRNITYTLTKEYISKESLDGFIPAQILALNDISIFTNNMTNDKSYVFANNDLVLNNQSYLSNSSLNQDSEAVIQNIGVDLLRKSSSRFYYGWKEKKRFAGVKVGWKHKDIIGGTKTNVYYEDGLPAIFAANNNFIAKSINLINAKDIVKNEINTRAISNVNAPTFTTPIVPYIKFVPINTGYLYSMNGANMPYILGRFDEMFANANSLVLKSFDNLKTSKAINAGSLILAQNNISIDTDGNIYNSGLINANNININAKNYESYKANIYANAIINAKENILIKDGLILSNDLWLNADNININGSNLNAKNNILLNANKNINIDTIEYINTFNTKGADTSFSGTIITHKQSNLKAKNININANDINLISANLYANDNLNINAKNNILIGFKKESINTHTEIKSKGFLSKKIELSDYLSENILQSNLLANNININANDTTIQGTNLLANDKIKIYSDNIFINPASYNTLNSSYVAKSSFGGLKKSLDYTMQAKQNLQSSALVANDIDLNVKNNLDIISANLYVNDNLNINTKNLNILAAYENNQKQEIHQKSSFNPLGILRLFNIGNQAIYTNIYSENGSKDGIAKLSDITAKNININTDFATITANLNASDGIRINSSDEIKIINAVNTHDEYSIFKKTQIKLARFTDILKDLKPKSSSELKKDTSIKLKIAEANYKKATNKSSKNSAISSNLKAKNIDIVANEDILIQGSDIGAADDINLISKNGNVYISNSTDTIDTNTALKQAKAILSLSIQNEYAQIAPAIIAIKDATKQLEKVKKEYDEYKKQKSKLQANLSDIKQRYKNKEVGIDYSDIEDLTEILNEIKDEEKYYLTNIALATTNLASKTSAALSQVAAASASSGTYGFSAGISASISGNDTKTQTTQTTSTASNLSAGNNIFIKTNQDKDSSINITGSNLIADNDINLQTKDLNIKSSQDIYEYNSKSKDLSGNINFTFYGGGGGALGLNYELSHANSQSYINNNSQIQAKNDINIDTSNDAIIKGANLRAGNEVNLNIGNNLSLESQRNRYDTNSKSIGFGAGIGFGGTTNAKNILTNSMFDKNHLIDTSTIQSSSINANFNQTKNNYLHKQTILSLVTANSVNINTNNNTHLKGSLISAGYYDKNGNFIDNGNLNLITNTLTYENLSNISYEKGSSLNLGANYAFNNNPINQENNQIDSNQKISSVSISNNKNLLYSHSKTLATIGNGNLIIKDMAKSSELDRLNKDINKLNKELANTKINSSIDASIDTRWFSKEGREEIKKEFEDLDKNMKTIANTLPNENSENKIEAISGKTWNFIADWVTLGILPSNWNNGGFIGKIPNLFGVENYSNKVMIVVDENKEIYKKNKQDFEPFKNSDIFKNSSKNIQEYYNGVDSLYISKPNSNIANKYATTYIHTNGIATKELTSLTEGLIVSNCRRNGVEFTTFYNSNGGFLADILGVVVDKFSWWETASAKQYANYLDNLATLAKKQESKLIHLTNFSGGVAIKYAGVSILKKDKRINNIPKGIFYTTDIGSPINKNTMKKLLSNTNIIYTGSYANKGDIVHKFIGFNGKQKDENIFYIDFVRGHRILNYWKLEDLSPEIKSFDEK